MKRIIEQFAMAMSLALVSALGCNSSQSTPSVADQSMPSGADSPKPLGRVRADQNVPATEYRPFVLTDFLPPECFEGSSEIRVIVRINEAGEMEVENKLPTHRYVTEIFGGMLVALEEGKQPMSGFPKDATSAGPNVSFQAGMLRLDWFNGAEHQLEGTLQLNGYTFVSDPNYPLTFKVVQGKGYVCICGRGKVVRPGGEPVQVGAGETVSMWIARIASPDVLTREAAAEALGWLARQEQSAKKQAIEALSASLKDTSFEVRRNAIESLVRLGAASELSAIEKAPGREPDDAWMEAIKTWARQELSGSGPA
ncbi:MAG: HEAT repeat domain-containing protein [bacterium]